MAVYQYQNGVWTHQEQHLYGAERLGVHTKPAPIAATGHNYAYLAVKKYELTNHLGNVMAVVTDRRFVHASGTFATAEVVSATDYFPFGMEMTGRTFSSDAYSFGFNGKVEDSEILPNGRWQDYGFRAYRNDICRFVSVDPLTSEYPWYTPYQFAGNMPIAFIDLDGLEPAKPGKQGEIKSAYVQGEGGRAIGKKNWVFLDDKWCTSAASKEFTIFGKRVSSHNGGSFSWSGGEGDWGQRENWNECLFDYIKIGLAPKYYPKNNKATCIEDIVIASLYQLPEVHLVGEILLKVINDPEMQKFEEEILESVKSDPQFGKTAFSRTYKPKPRVGRRTKAISFGGNKRYMPLMTDFFNPLSDGHSESVKMVHNELFWALGHAKVVANVNVAASGTTKIIYTLSDTFDFKPSNKRGGGYNFLASGATILQVNLGCNLDLKINATWKSIR